MCRDYAQIVSKLVLLMGAGAAVRTAWELIVRDYQRKREQGEQPLRYAYEEMALTNREMQNGIAEIKAYADTPCMYRIKNDRRLKYGGELIDELMAQNGIAEIQHGETDYAQMYPYETTEKLIELKLIKELTDEEAQSGTMFKPSELRQSVSAQEVDALMQDEVAATLIESEDGVADRTKQSFENGEVVTLDEIKKRVKGFNKNTTYLKVLARGTLDKSLTVEADGFSLQAVKMIVLTGGTVIKSGSKSCRRRGIK